MNPERKPHIPCKVCGMEVWGSPERRHKYYCDYCFGELCGRESERSSLRSLVEKKIKSLDKIIIGREHYFGTQDDYDEFLKRIDAWKQELFASLPSSAENEIYEEMTGGKVRRFDSSGEDIKIEKGTGAELQVKIDQGNYSKLTKCSKCGTMKHIYKGNVCARCVFKDNKMAQKDSETSPKCEVCHGNWGLYGHARNCPLSKIKED